MKKFFALGSAGILTVIFTFNNPLWTDEQGTRATLKKNSLTPVEVGGYAWFAGSETALYRTKFKATNDKGQDVAGAVTRSPWGYSTIHYDNK